MQGSATQRNVRSSMSDPDMFLNYTPTYAVSDVGKQAQLGGTATRRAFPDSVHIPEGRQRPSMQPCYSGNLLGLAARFCCKMPVLAWPEHCGHAAAHRPHTATGYLHEIHLQL